MKKCKSIFLLFTLTIIFFLGCGTIGGFKTIEFSTSKRNLEIGMDSLFANYPEYNIPDKWKQMDDWKEKGYDFLEYRIFYFKSPPEEMYLVSYIVYPNDSAYSNGRLAIRFVSHGLTGWLKENYFSDEEKQRIEARFEREIISKLEKYTSSSTKVVD
jgi:hypothetical protein